jgi:hypothetical protein
VQAGTVTLEARINSDLAITESDTTNNTNTITVTFEDTPPLRMKLVPVRYTEGGATYLASDFHRNRLFNWLGRAYPIPYVQATVQVLDFPSTSTRNADNVNSQIGQLRSLDLAAGGDSRVVYYGMVDDGGGFMRGKSAGIPASIASGPTGSGNWGWDFDGSYGDWYGGHEIGHTRGRYHAEFCGAGGGRSYPYPDGRIGPADNSFYGFDIDTLTVYSPETWTDLMTYCDFEWVSDFTYEGIRDYLVSHDTPRTVALTGEYLAVFGMVNLTQNTATLDTMYLLANPADIPDRVEGEYSIRLLDSGGATLADYPFTPLELDTGPPEPGDGGGEGDQMALINEMVAWDDATARVAIIHNGSELAGQDVSANAPTVTVTAPNGGETLSSGNATFTWTASDADGDPLTYVVQYSPDNGATWSTLTTGLTEASFEIAVADLPGSDQALIRVLASDGINTGQDQSDATFTVTGKAPQASITTPADGSSYLEGQTILLQGSAIDLEDGTLTGDSLTWSSDLDGDLGTGVFTTTTLSVGAHTITLTATDSDSQSDTDQVTLTVGEEAESTAALVVEPAGFSIYATVGADPVQKTLSIRDAAGGEFAWSASSDQSWLTLSAVSGAAPDVITATISPAMVSAGMYTATITVTADGGLADSPQTLNAYLTVQQISKIYLPLVIKE